MECRGRGDNEHATDGRTLVQGALNSIELMQQLGNHRFSFADHSIGGGVRITLVLKHLDKLEKLPLMASIRSKGLIGESCRENVDVRLEACRKKDQISLNAIF